MPSVLASPWAGETLARELDVGNVTVARHRAKLDKPASPGKRAQADWHTISDPPWATSSDSALARELPKDRTTVAKYRAALGKPPRPHESTTQEARAITHHPTPHPSTPTTPKNA